MMNLHFTNTHQDSLAHMSDNQKFQNERRHLFVADNNPYRMLSPVMTLLPGCKLIDLDHFLVNFPLLRETMKNMDEILIFLDHDYEVFTKLDCLNALAATGIKLDVFIQGECSEMEQEKMKLKFLRPFVGLNPFLEECA